ncbi:Protein kinase domain [Carpediemonas membranifera]|uniref:Protein kinase domain n=1 Tax=Carpediemonas membranifera TaxID=201153 RepID=A0A8J6B899_9EUKA|nr:Protein kinase domain [Carpediemonas membranifera]|eukprot:KAG9392082.1 Protein kinase domain [Carpediemonas membranifera]
MVMPRAEGDLMKFERGRRKRGYIYTWRELQEMLFDMVMSLAEIHHAGIVHRDIKPANFLVMRRDVSAPGQSEYSVVLGDFGISVKVNKEEEQHTGQATVAFPTAIAGTGKFLPPETLERGESGQHEVHQKGDIWALGITLYLMIYGKHPFCSSDLTRETVAEYTRTLKGKTLEFPDTMREFKRGRIRVHLAGDVLVNPEEIDENDETYDRAFRKFEDNLRLANNLIRSCLKMNHRERKSAQDIIKEHVFRVGLSDIEHSKRGLEDMNHRVENMKPGMLMRGAITFSSHYHKNGKSQLTQRDMRAADLKKFLDEIKFCPETVLRLLHKEKAGRRARALKREEQKTAEDDMTTTAESTQLPQEPKPAVTINPVTEAPAPEPNPAPVPAQVRAPAPVQCVVPRPQMHIPSSHTNLQLNLSFRKRQVPVLTQAKADPVLVDPRTSMTPVLSHAKVNLQQGLDVQNTPNVHNVTRTDFTRLTPMKSASRPRFSLPPSTKVDLSKFKS